MKKIYITSDLHFCHNKEFLFKPRGFNCINDMNITVVRNWNNLITEEDDVYILGDLMLNNNEEAIKLVKELKGNLHIILGNHDTNSRIALYKELPKVIEVIYATVIKYQGYHFYLSHYPTFTANLEKESLKACMINLYGHTHQKNNFYEDIPFMYHVGLDSHNCTPVLIDDIIIDCENKVLECKEKL